MNDGPLMTNKWYHPLGMVETKSESGECVFVIGLSRSQGVLITP
jgi:hypothetical protein